ncbi:protoheme IX farnesyltransferase [Ramlibacter sp. USB13]|uniref:Protoheme IX farnesyltransferase n=1 Tax=Ramlibacter cellulosilyticus TaxID=2764187 RepID=A0A923MVT9_9BURK|nr:heme o synthase [Ramlibacter cellulosilyticus]MBC5785643.1 protoheme IX farnesyltransferase [Ramlibacter cellulosilyticus]
MASTVLACRPRGLALARAVVSLFKLRIGVLIMVTALVGLAVTPGAALTVAQVAVLALSVLGASGAAGAYNQYAEHEADRLMARTRGRAFATGALPRHPAWLLAIALLLVAAVAAAWVALNPAAAAYVFLGAFFYGVVYTLWLKRRTSWNIVVGGLAGSFAVLAGAAAADPVPGPQAWLLALVLFLWTPPHFWSLAIANREDYRQAGVPMLPVVVGDRRAAWIVFASTVALVAASLVPLAFGAGWIHALGAVGGGAHFLRKAWLLARDPQRRTALGSFLASLVQLSAVLAATTVDALVR